MTATPAAIPRRRPSLAFRISLLTAAVAVIAALISGALAVSLINKNNESAARATLSTLADAVEAQARTQARPEAGPERAELAALHVEDAVIMPDGRIVGDTALARDAAAKIDSSRLLAGHSISTTTRIDGSPVLIEGRPIVPAGASAPTSAIVLVQRRSDALAIGQGTIRRLILALVIGVGVAIVLGLVVARRLTRPLRRTAEGAHALAAGQRNITVAPEGPAEVAEVAEALNTLSAELSHSEARQREFLLSVSHDLRTPLTAILGYAESMADGVIEPEQTREVGVILTGEAHRLQRLVTDLLDLARLDALDFRINLELIDLGELARAAAPVWANRCAAAGVLFALELANQPLPVRTDPARMRQVLDGLFDNALRVTPAGRPIVLTVRAEAGPAGWPLAAAEVRDGGPGLNPDDFAVAFERGELFRRYQGVRQVGTGLGLAIVHRLVVRLGARIEAGPAAEGGARFTVRLPFDAGATS